MAPGVFFSIENGSNCLFECLRLSTSDPDQQWTILQSWYSLNFKITWNWNTKGNSLTDSSSLLFRLCRHYSQKSVDTWSSPLYVFQTCHFRFYCYIRIYFSTKAFLWILKHSCKVLAIGAYVRSGSDLDVWGGLGHCQHFRSSQWCLVRSFSGVNVRALWRSLGFFHFNFAKLSS